MIPRPGQGLSATPSTAGGSTSRSSTPTGHDGDARNRSASGATGPVDHTTSHTYGQSLRSYPPDCPPANVVWFHAVDVAKRKLQLQASSRRAKGTTSASAATTTTVAGAASDDSKAAKPPQPKKFVAFEPQDCQAIESAYQRWLEAKEDERARSASDRRNRSASDVNGEPNVRVPVHEDYLFEVDIAERELRPVYWLGPTYEVRRGSWFYQEGSTLRPCDENLAGQLETGYLKVQPWKYPPPPPRRGASTATPAKDATKDATPKASVENLKGAAEAQPSPTQQHQPGTYRLFGPYSNTIATYQDATTVWLTSESVLSWVTSTMYERFVGGAYMSGVKLVRGYTEQKKGAAEDKRPSTPPPTSARDGLQPDEKQQRMLKRRSAPPTTKADAAEGTASASSRGQQEPRQSRLTRQLSTMLESGDSKEEQIRKQEEQAMEDDYNTAEGEKQGREIEHLVLVTHGIGQLLGLKMENINFVHDVNTLRKTLKTVYANSPDLKALNGELGSGRGNCRIQVLPVCWRHLVDFPRRRHEVRPREHDLGETADQDDADEYPSLEDITIEGMAFARSLISDLALDVLLYQSAYREQISHIVRDESNRIYKLFVERNPGFKGKVHIIGHSLGSAIMFDILCRQKERPKPAQQKWRNPLSFWPSREDVQQTPPQDPRDLTFDFDVHDFYCLGSPVGLFQMLKGRTIAARHVPHSAPSESPLDPDLVEDPFLATQGTGPQSQISPITGLPYSVSSPKVAQLFNIFHPSDPISYRMEPLISPVMSSLKPQQLPYTKKGFLSSAPQGLTAIGTKVSGLWSSLSATIPRNVLTRKLGLTSEDLANLDAQQKEASSASSDEKKKQLAEGVESADQKQSGQGKTPDDPILIDDEMETLYQKFQQKHADLLSAKKDENGGDGNDGDEGDRPKRLAEKLRSEEAKIRALNRNGRVDYSIQESMMDFNPISTIASHMSYWSDEDVSHFIISQLLSRRSDAAKK